MNLMFSDLPDGVSLELHPVTEHEKKTELLTVNLIIGDGIVNSGKFRKDATLWDISQELIPKDRFLEEDRICISLLSKCFSGPGILKRVTLSALKFEGALNLSLTRKYSSENLNTENDKNSVRRNSKIISASFNLNRHFSNKPSTSKEASTDLYDSNTTLEDDSTKESIYERKKKWNKALRQKLRRNITYKPEIPISSLQGNAFRFTDKRNVKTIMETNFTTNLTAKAAIDKHFYLTPEKKLNDLKYLNSRQGIAYINKQPFGMIPREDSAVDLLDLGRDSTRSSDGSIEIKLFLPDETAIQAMFRCDETIEDVFKFLNPLLQCQPSDYFLYVSNPTGSVKKNVSLHELEDLSGVNLYLGLNPKLKKTWPKCKPYLKEEHLPKNNK
ncbi:unnamed protein product [Nezara viridula]|uniref:UBX domain-containing protein n=1 Tax=Nezara viridula TaxID=85310 RepID=A0A9P0HA38_NEZVI|nr:unnamed protein product [Nezara viridula]